MLANQIGLKITFNKIGRHDIRCAVDPHDVKSVAGHLFHSPTVKSVCVYNPQGLVHLYLRKLEDGGIVREEN